MKTVSQTDLPLPLLRRGKVRDVYEVDADRLLIVATDRVSAFDVVMNEAVPHKGAVLTQLTAWWLGQLPVEHHMISADTAEILRAVPQLADYRGQLERRAMLVWRTEPFPVECVVRGYLAGSAWQEYREQGTLAGEPMPKGLVEAARLDPPLFSPATKAQAGHDENITFDEVVALIGADAGQLSALSAQLYGTGARMAESRGIIIADTKFEFGNRGAGKIILIDEVLTPDSSRFWLAESYRPGTSPPSLDKQPLRDYLAAERDAGRWNGDSPPPPLPSEVVEAMSERYLEIYRRLTGAALPAAA